MTSLITRLQTTFKSVPNVQTSDYEEWSALASSIHGNEDDTNLILLLATSLGAKQIALNSAHFFKFSDSGDSVDKTMLASIYLRLSTDYMSAYENSKAKVTGTTFKIAKRADR